MCSRDLNRGKESSHHEFPAVSSIKFEMNSVEGEGVVGKEYIVSFKMCRELLLTEYFSAMDSEKEVSSSMVNVPRPKKQRRPAVLCQNHSVLMLSF